MKKTLHLLLFSLLLSLNLSATDVSGLISSNTTWTVSNSPYIVTGNILVAEGATLTIEPGVEVKFNDSKTLQVNGSLVARGTAADSITFTSNTSAVAGAWGNIYFTDSSVDAVIDSTGAFLGGCILEYCIIEYGGTIENVNVGMIRLDKAWPSLRHSALRSSISAALSIYSYDYDSLNYPLNNLEFNTCNTGIAFSTTCYGFKVQNCTFLRNGCAISGNASVSISNNLFSFNAKAISLDWGFIQITENEFSYNALVEPGGSYMSAIINVGSRLYFANNLCHHNSGNIFYCNMVESVTFLSNIITDNSTSEAGNLFYIYQDSHFENDTLLIENNIITNNGPYCTFYIHLYDFPLFMSSNMITNNYSYDHILYVAPGNEAPISIFDNVITQNLSASGTLSALSGTINLNNNSIYDNRAIYSIRNINSPTYQPYLDISDNYWDVETQEELSDIIYDFFDDANLGITMFGSILIAPLASNPVLPPSNVTKTDLGNNKVKISWNPNPENNVKGYNVYWGNYEKYSFEDMADAGMNTSYILEGASVNDLIAVTAYDNEYLPGKKNGNWLNDNMLNGHESSYSFELHFPIGTPEPAHKPFLFIYPVPTHELLIIQLQAQDDYQRISLYNSQGQLVKTMALTDLKSEMNIRDLPAGMYIVKADGNDGVASRRILKL